MRKKTKSPATRNKKKPRTLAFPVEFRLRVVKLFLEEGYGTKLIAEQFGISTHSVTALGEGLSAQWGCGA